MTEALQQQQPKSQNAISLFSNYDAFIQAHEIVKPLVASDLIPDTFRGNTANCIIALELSQRVQASPLAVMQNIYVVHGKPSWSSQFLISSINSCGKFSPLRYKEIGERGKDTYGIIAWATDKTGEVLEGSPVTIGMAKAEGWYNRNGSKWKTMPDLMLRYRAATFFSRLYCPELTMGMRTTDELEDMVDVTPTTNARQARKALFKAETEKTPEIASNAKTDENHTDTQDTTENATETKTDGKETIPDDTSALQSELNANNVSDVTAEDIKKACNETGNKYEQQFVIKNLIGYVKWVRDMRNAQKSQTEGK